MPHGTALTPFLHAQKQEARHKHQLYEAQHLKQLFTLTHERNLPFPRPSLHETLGSGVYLQRACRALVPPEIHVEWEEESFQLLFSPKWAAQFQATLDVRAARKTLRRVNPSLYGWVCEQLDRYGWAWPVMTPNLAMHHWLDMMIGMPQCEAEYEYAEEIVARRRRAMTEGLIRPRQEEDPALLMQRLNGRTLERWCAQDGRLTPTVMRRLLGGELDLFPDLEADQAFSLLRPWPALVSALEALRTLPAVPAYARDVLSVGGCALICALGGNGGPGDTLHEVFQDIRQFRVDAAETMEEEGEPALDGYWGWHGHFPTAVQLPVLFEAPGRVRAVLNALLSVPTIA